MSGEKHSSTHGLAKMQGKMGLLLSSVACLLAVFAQTTAGRFHVPAIVVFGDETADVGNNNFLPEGVAKANFPHNGIDFPGGTATGRFSNGYNVVDFLAMKIGFEKSPPAHLSITSESEIYHGLNFASGESGILDDTSVPGQNISISLNQQIRDFEKIREVLSKQIGSITADRYLSESLFFISSGSNDLLSLISMFEVHDEQKQDSLVERLAPEFKLRLQMLYGLGARKFVVLGASMLGCVPALRKDVPNNGCSDHTNKLSQKFNKAIQSVLSSLASDLKGFSYSFVNVYDIVSALSSDPQKYGFTEMSSACCGSGVLNAGSGCTPEAAYCSDRNQYFFWDLGIPSQAASKLIAGTAFKGKKFATPLTVEELALSAKPRHETP